MSVNNVKGENNSIDWDSVNKRTKKFSLEGEKKLAKCVHVYDGDTIQVVFPLQNELYRWSCRLSGVDTPELRTKNLVEKKFGYVVRDKLREKIMNKMVIVHCEEFDKYGRLLGRIYLENEMIGGAEGAEGSGAGEGGLCVNDWLIQNKYAFKYDGGTKNDWSSYLASLEN